MTDETRGSKGGTARAAKLSPEARSAIAKEAAKRRWSKAKKSADAPMSVPESATPLPPDNPQEHHCPACAAGEPLGQGTHVAGSLEHPFTPVPAQLNTGTPVLVDPTPVEVPQKSAKPTPRKNLPKQFKEASSYAERRLPLAIKEKAKLVAALTEKEAEINELLRVIRVLGSPSEAYAAQQSIPQYQPAAYPPQFQSYPTAPSGVSLPDTQVIDPNLYQANAGPVPSAGGPAVRTSIIPNTSQGGAMDLDYTPREDEENKLPAMGDGWI